jgi:hypothetical protein
MFYSRATSHHDALPTMTDIFPPSAIRQSTHSSYSLEVHLPSLLTLISRRKAFSLVGTPMVNTPMADPEVMRTWDDPNEYVNHQRKQKST